MTKVLFIGLDVYSRTGGIGHYSRRLLKALSEFTGSLIASCVAISLWDSIEFGTKAPSAVRFIPCNHNKLRVILEFTRHCLLQKPDAFLYGHVLLAPLVLWGRILRPGARHFLFVYGFEVWGNEYRRTTHWECRLVQRCFDRIVTISRYTQKRMIKVYGLNEERFVLLPPAVDIGESDRKPRDSNHKILLSVCRLTPEARHKGVDRVIRALPKVLEAFPNVTYNIVGEGPMIEELKRIAEESGVEKHVHFHGYIDNSELEQIYARSDIFVLPSSGEGFGIAFLEAFLHHLPVICGNIDASVEVVTNGYNGFTINPYSSDDIAEAIIHLLTDTKLATNMGRNGYHTVLERYTHAVFRQALGSILLVNR